MSASGSIDLGNQSFSLKPRIGAPEGERQTIRFQGIEIPVSDIPWQIAGPWSSPGVSLDQAAIADLIQQNLTGRLEDELGNQIGDILGEDSDSDALGSILGDVLGGRSSGGNTETDVPDASSTEAEATTEASAEAIEQDSEVDSEPQEPEDVAIDILRGILGDND